MKITIENQRANIFTPYNSNFVGKIKNIGGAKWNGSEKCWTTPIDAIDAVREIMREIYGMADNDIGGETVKLRVTVIHEKSPYCQDVNLLGKCLCHAYGRDSGGKPGDNVAYISGSPQSGGSVKNWRSVVPDGAVIILSNVSKNLYDAYLQDPDEDYSIELVEEKISRQKLFEEKERLLARIGEIEGLLKA